MGRGLRGSMPSAVGSRRSGGFGVRETSAEAWQLHLPAAVKSLGLSYPQFPHL